jgi:hypothetical protein
VYRGLSGTERDRLISKGFLRYGLVHGFDEERTRILLKSLAIPAGFEPATHGVEIRYSNVSLRSPLHSSGFSRALILKFKKIPILIGAFPLCGRVARVILTTD